MIFSLRPRFSPHIPDLPPPPETPLASSIRPSYLPFCTYPSALRCPSCSLPNVADLLPLRTSSLPASLSQFAIVLPFRQSLFGLRRPQFLVSHSFDRLPRIVDLESSIYGASSVVQTQTEIQSSIASSLHTNVATSQLGSPFVCPALPRRPMVPLSSSSHVP